MSTNEKPFSPINWGGQHESPTTGYHQATAGSGRHEISERLRRARQASWHPAPLPKIAPPIGDDAAAFVDEYLVNERARPHFGARLAGAVVGGVLGHELARAAWNRGRR